MLHHPSHLHLGSKSSIIVNRNAYAKAAVISVIRIEIQTSAENNLKINSEFGTWWGTKWWKHIKIYFSRAVCNEKVFCFYTSWKNGIHLEQWWIRDSAGGRHCHSVWPAERNFVFRVLIKNPESFIPPRARLRRKHDTKTMMENDKNIFYDDVAFLSRLQLRHSGFH